VKPDTAEEMHARYADRLHQNQHGSDLPWTKCRVPSCLLAVEVSASIRRLCEEREKAVWVAQNLSAAQSGAEWMKEKAARFAEQCFKAPCDPAEVAAGIRELSAEGDDDAYPRPGAQAAQGDG
jgi:hypothetical protein